MAELLAEPTLYVILILMVILGVVTFYEIRFIRRKRAERDSNRMQVDDIYNQIITSRAVSKALRQQGRDTKEADLVILQADTAFSRGNYVEAKSASDKAKEMLRSSKERMPEEPVLQSAPAPVQEVKGEEACEVPFQEAKKMPKNFLESKFMICSVRDEAAEAEKAGKDVSAAKDSLRQADQAFQAEQYTEALKHALRAKKVLEPRQEAAPQSTKVKDLASVEKIPSAVVVKAPVSKCSKCAAALEPDDTFCAKCGTRVERDIRCPRCSHPVKVEDAYCRKCGLPLRSD